MPLGSFNLTWDNGFYPVVSIIVSSVHIEWWTWMRRNIKKEVASTNGYKISSKRKKGYEIMKWNEQIQHSNKYNRRDP
jgi:hypothetical protein